MIPSIPLLNTDLHINLIESKQEYKLYPQAFFQKKSGELLNGKYFIHDDLRGISISYFSDGLLHRVDGPAIVLQFNLREMYYINGFKISEEVFNWLRDNQIETIPFSSIEDETLFKLTWGVIGHEFMFERRSDWC